MYYTGFADEAADGIDGQIAVTKALGWSFIETRNVDGKNIHDLLDADFDRLCGRLKDAGVGVNCFGSAIANWGKRIDEPFDSSLAEARRAIPRMVRLGTKMVRIMSFGVLANRGPEDQMEEERFARLRDLQRMFADHGILPVHENCMCYGGMGWLYSLRLVEKVPGLKLVFDTGNTIFTPDFLKPEPRPMQSAWDFYTHVREHIAYVHIKDGIHDPVSGSHRFVFPGEGEADVRRILADMLARGYDGGLSIEPHLKVIAHERTDLPPEEARREAYVEYGRRLMRMVDELRAAASR